MNLLSLNIRGVSETRKVEWVQTLKRKHKIDFVALQETHFIDSSNIDVTGCWGSNDFSCEAVDAYGRSGGLLCIWNPTIFNSNFCQKSRYYLAIGGEWNGFSGTVFLVNVYAPQSNIEKRLLWDELTTLKNSHHGTWVFFGDFNVVRNVEERINSHFCQSSANDFNSFINRSGLTEFSMGGRRYTYLSLDNNKLSKLDRFLVCSNFMLAQPRSSVTALPRDHSDHSPILLCNSTVDFGPPPTDFTIHGCCGMDSLML